MTHRETDGAAARLRHSIDTGRTGDKVNAFDPAAAPLGTDEEAAGTPTPSAPLDREVRAANARESPANDAPFAAQPGGARRSRWALPVIAILAVLLLAWLVV